MEHHSQDNSAVHTETAEATPAAPPLRICHLLVGTACVAVFLGAMQAAIRALDFAQPVGTAPPDSGIFRQAIIVIGRVALGVGLAGLVLFVARRRRGWPFPVHPGEFLHVRVGVLAVDYLVLTAVVAIVHFRCSVSNWLLIVRTIQSTFAAITLIVCLWALRHAGVRRWRVFWLSMMLDIGAQLFLEWRGRMVLPVPASLLVLPIVVFCDRKEWFERPWTHWVGIGLYLGLCLCTGLALVFETFLLWRLTLSSITIR